MKNFFELYDTILGGISTEETVTSLYCGKQWTGVETQTGLGLAMTTYAATRPRTMGKMKGMALPELAQAAKSWNFLEAGCGLAAANAFYNTPARLETLGAYEPFERYCTHGLDLTGKHIGVVGHLNMPAEIQKQAAEVLILERNPQPGDYPDSACDWILPKCDVVIITASTLVNKTLPHLLELCQDAYTILAGPSCPLCPELLDLGLDRIAGLVVTDRAGMTEKIEKNLSGPPYPLGKPFLLRRD